MKKIKMYNTNDVIISFGHEHFLPTHMLEKLQERDCIIAEILKKKGLEPGPCAKAIHGS